MRHKQYLTSLNPLRSTINHSRHHQTQIYADLSSMSIPKHQALHKPRIVLYNDDSLDCMMEEAEFIQDKTRAGGGNHSLK